MVSAPFLHTKFLIPRRKSEHLSRPLAWYQLDAGDSDPATFLACLIECLRALAAQRALQVDALLEDVHCDLMRYCARLGNRSALMRQYQTLQHLLHAELGIAPLPATQALYAMWLAQ